VDDVVDESVGGCRSGVLGDVGPDFVEIPLGELAARGLVVNTAPAPSKLIKACLHVGTKLLTSLIAFLQEPECLADDFTGCLVKATLDLFVHESFELWRKRHVHANQPSGAG
jgi:hypothetical protein